MAKAALHKEKLIETAMRLFRRRGYASVGLQEILKESGAPKGSLYHYFPSGKEALAEAAVRLAGSKMLVLFESLADKHKQPAPFIKAYCRQMADWMEASDFSSGSPITTTILETVPDSSTIKLASEEVMGAWLEVVCGVYRASGLTKADSIRQAETLISAVEGALILCRVQASRKPLNNIAKVLSQPFLDAEN